MMTNIKYPRKSYTIADYYKFYLSDIIRETIYDIPYKQYRMIVEDYFKSISDLILEQGKQFKIPYRLGTLRIIKSLPKNFNSKSLSIDFHQSKLQGKIVYYINEHSNYYKYRLYWSKKNVIARNKSKYQFVLTRANKRHLAHLIKNEQLDYVEID